MLTEVSSITTRAAPDSPAYTFWPPQEGLHKLMTFKHSCPHHWKPPGGMYFYNTSIKIVILTWIKIFFSITQHGYTYLQGHPSATYIFLRKSRKKLQKPLDSNPGQQALLRSSVLCSGYLAMLIIQVMTEFN